MDQCTNKACPNSYIGKYCSQIKEMIDAFLDHYEIIKS